MSADDPSSHGFSLRRWSRRKLEAARAAPAPAAAPLPPRTAEPPPPLSASPAATAAQITDAQSLPPIESLTIDSDFSAFLDPKVDQAVKLQALKKLFRDPRFNVMDGLDVYIDDYSIADPIAPDLARQLAHARYVFDPPRTRVNEAGVVEDVPAGEAVSEAGAASPQGALTESQAPLSATAAPNPAPDTTADSAAGVAQPREGSEPARR